MGSPASKIGIADRRKWNEGFKCKNPKCSSLRQGFNSLCSRCQARLQTLGDFRARILPRSAYANEWQLVHKLMRTHASHEGLISDIAFLDELLDDGRDGRSPGGFSSAGKIGQVIARQADRGSTGAQAWNEITAYSLFCSTHESPMTLGRYPLSAAFSRAYTGQKRGPQAESFHGKNPLPVIYLSRSERASLEKMFRDRLSGTIQEVGAYFQRAEVIRNEEIAAKEKGVSESASGRKPFISMCTVCAYNSRKAEEKRIARTADPAKATENNRRWLLATKENRKKKEEENAGPANKILSKM